MTYSDFYSGARDEAFRLLIWGVIPIGVPVRKRLENHQKKTTCVYEGQYVPRKGKRKVFLIKIDRGPPTKKTGKPPKKQLVFMKGNLWT